MNATFPDNGAAPIGWRVSRLGVCCSVLSGSLSYTDFLKLPREDEPDTIECMGVKVSDMNLPGNECRFNTATLMKRLPEALARRKLVPPNVVVFPKRGAAIATNKKRLTTTWTVLDPNLIAVSPGETLDWRFLFYWLQTLDLRTITEPGPTPQLNKKDLVPLPMLIPTSLEEQRKIAGVLGLVQRAIEQQERLIQVTAELKKALLHQLFTQGLRGEPQKESEIGPVPASWEVVPLGTLAKIGNGSTPKRDNPAYWDGGTIPWLNSAKIHERFIAEADQFVTDAAVKECHLPRVRPGSVLIAITGQGKTLGNSALVLFETCINQHLAYAKFTSPQVAPEFVLWYLQTRYDHLRSVSQAGGSTKGALTCGYLKTYPVPLPPLEEQHEIAEVFATLDRKERMHERKRAALADLFRTLLHQLMTAQIRVEDLDLPEISASCDI